MFNKKVKELRKKGLLYKEIGVIVGVSKQRIHQIITGYVSPSGRRVIPKRRSETTIDI